jgi:hypothetical protein
MEAFTPLLNVLVLLGTLSVATERLANLVKLGHPDLRQSRKRLSRPAEKERERRIGNRVLIVSVLLALVVKAESTERTPAPQGAGPDHNQSASHRSPVRDAGRLAFLPPNRASSGEHESDAPRQRAGGLHRAAG